MTFSAPYLLIGALFLIILVLQRLQTRWAVDSCRKYAEQYIEHHALDAEVEHSSQYPPSRLWLHAWKGTYWATIRHSNGQIEYLRIRPGLATPARFDVYPSRPVDQPGAR